MTASSGAVNVTGMPGFVLCTRNPTVLVAGAMVVACVPASAPPVVGGVAGSGAAVLGDSVPGGGVVVALSEDESSPPHAVNNSALTSAAARTAPRVDRLSIYFLLRLPWPRVWRAPSSPSIGAAFRRRGVWRMSVARWALVALRCELRRLRDRRCRARSGFRRRRGSRT